MIRYRLAILAAALLWSSAGAAIKLSHLNAWQLAAGRSIVAGLMLALVFKAGRQRVTRRGLWAAIAYAATVVLFVIANKLTTSANAIFLQDTAPLYVLVLSPLLLAEKPTRGELAAAPVFLLGLALFFFDRLQPGQLWGNVIALLSGVAFALCILGLRATHEEGTAVLVWGNALAGLIAIGPALASLPLHGGPAQANLGFADLGIVLLGVIVFALQTPIVITQSFRFYVWLVIHLDVTAVWTGHAQLGINLVGLAMLIWSGSRFLASIKRTRVPRAA